MSNTMTLTMDQLDEIVKAAINKAVAAKPVSVPVVLGPKLTGNNMTSIRTICNKKGGKAVIEFSRGLGGCYRVYAYDAFQAKIKQATELGNAHKANGTGVFAARVKTTADE